MVERVRRDHGVTIDFLLLSDPGSRVIGRYGLLNPEGRGWPHPTTFVLDKRGVVHWKFVETDYRVRPTNEQILEALDQASRAGG